MKSYICVKTLRQLRSYKVFATDYIHTKCLVSSTVYRANVIWETLPSEYKGCSITIYICPITSLCGNTLSAVLQSKTMNLFI